MTSEKDVVIKHALESRENLKITLDIYFNGRDVLNEVKNVFLNKLKNRFVGKRCDFQVTKATLIDNSTGTYKELFFTKGSWRTQYQVGLETEGPEKPVCIGVKKPGTGTTEEEEERTIKSDLDNGIETGDNGGPWVWWVYYDVLRNLSNGDILTRMHFEGDICKKFGDIFEIIDKHVRGI